VALRRLDLSAADTDPAVAAEVQALLRRGAVPDQRVREGARAILASVKAGGDAAVHEANCRFGGGRADGSLLVSRAELQAARDSLPPRIRAGLEQMIENIRRLPRRSGPRRASRRSSRAWRSNGAGHLSLASASTPRAGPRPIPARC